MSILINLGMRTWEAMTVVPVSPVLVYLTLLYPYFSFFCIYMWRERERVCVKQEDYEMSEQEQRSLMGLIS